MLIDRPTHKAALARIMAVFPVTGILGPRQSAKTTLVHEFSSS